ncbi:MAG: hypothetical protein OXJ53_06870 [Gammaproteobacteria bacterium]|nr:hypothetical protein [Gammaproteobacteria bacterium]
MQNPACTVCHTVMDPVAGAFQNYGDEGLYRDQWGGSDSLDWFYKEEFHVASETLEVVAPKDDPHVVSLKAALNGGNEGKELLRLDPRFDPPRPEGSEIWWHMAIDHVKVRDENGHEVQHLELQDVVADMDLCGNEDSQHDDYYVPWFCGQRIVLDVPGPGNYEVEIVLWFDWENRQGDETARRRLLDASLGWHIEGDTWYRDMRVPGFDGKRAPDARNSLQWLAGKIAGDDRFAEATVKFWWPAIMGREVAEPPEDGGDADFAGRLLESNAQTAEVARLARGFRRGFGGGPPYNLKDLLVEVALSRWFRAQTLSDDDPVRKAALDDVGARRLLTPEELARKTLALTGFQWGRPRIGSQSWRMPHEREWTSLTDTQNGYGMLYGGIDSAGVTERATDMTSVMAAVAQRHAIESSCPIVMKDLYLLPESDRRLFGGVDTSMAPTFESGKTFELESDDWHNKEALTMRARLAAGERTVWISFLNDFWDETEGDRNLRLDRLELRNSAGETIEAVELESLDPLGDGECNHPVGDHFALHCNGTLYVPIMVPADGEYVIEVLAWADQGGDELPRVEMILHGDTQSSVGAKAIKGKLAELYGTLLGVEATEDSPDVTGAYGLFLEIWQRRRESGYGGFFDWSEGVNCNWASDQHYLDGILEDAFVFREDWGDEWGAREDWDWEHINAHFDTLNWADPQAVAETWTVVLAYLLMDYRYLYL